jgi:signal transduction histidine kinase
VQVALYRIAQEALHNVAKHSSAQRAVTTLHCVPGPDGIAQEVRLSIIDDGMGFDLNQVPADRFGLTIMAERAEGIGATLSIDTTPGHGTRVVVDWQDATSTLL